MGDIYREIAKTIRANYLEADTDTISAYLRAEISAYLKDALTGTHIPKCRIDAALRQWEHEPGGDDTYNAIERLLHGT